MIPRIPDFFLERYHRSCFQVSGWIGSRRAKSSGAALFKLPSRAAARPPQHDSLTIRVICNSFLVVLAPTSGVRDVFLLRRWWPTARRSSLQRSRRSRETRANASRSLLSRSSLALRLCRARPTRGPSKKFTIDRGLLGDAGANRHPSSRRHSVKPGLPRQKDFQPTSAITFHFYAGYLLGCYHFTASLDARAFNSTDRHCNLHLCRIKVPEGRFKRFIKGCLVISFRFLAIVAPNFGTSHSDYSV